MLILEKLITAISSKVSFIKEFYSLKACADGCRLKTLVFSKWLNSFIWSVFLILVFLRAFLSEHAFLTLGFWYISIFVLVSFYLVFISKITLFSHPLNFAVFIFVASILVSLLFSKIAGRNFFVDIIEPYFFLPNILIFYITGKINQKQRGQLINVVFLAAGIIGVYALYQYFVVFERVLGYAISTGISERIIEVVKRKRVYATFISPNLFASYATVMLFWMMGFLINGYPFTRKTVYVIISTLLMAIAVLFTKSFGAIMALSLTFYLFVFFRSIKIKRAIFKRLFLGLVIIYFIFVILFIIFNWQRLSEILISADFPENSIAQRFDYWITSSKIVKDFPLTGIGWRKLGIVYKFYRLPSANTSHYSHNVFLQVMAEMGLVGLLSFLYMIIIALRSGSRILNNGGSQQGLKIGLFCAWSFFLIYNLIDISFYFGQVAFFWWMILGLFVNFSAEKQE